MEELNKMEDSQQIYTPIKVDPTCLLNGMYYIAFRLGLKYNAPEIAYIGQIIARIDGTNDYLLSKYDDIKMTNYIGHGIISLRELQTFQLYQTLEQFNKVLKESYYYF
jgi:hypothetical protein